MFAFAKKKKVVLSTEPTHTLLEAIKLAREGSKKRFNETIDMQLKLNVDPKHGDQMVRGTCVLPNGYGKKVVIAVLTSADNQELAKNVRYKMDG